MPFCCFDSASSVRTSFPIVFEKIELDSCWKSCLLEVKKENKKKNISNALWRY